MKYIYPSRYNNPLFLFQRNYEERYVGGQPKKSQSQDSQEQQQPTRNKTGTQTPPKDKNEPKQPIRDKDSVVIKGVTFYTAERERSDKEEEQRGNVENSECDADYWASCDIVSVCMSEAVEM